jgi:hypothetical protein
MFVLNLYSSFNHFFSQSPGLHTQRLIFAPSVSIEQFYSINNLNSLAEDKQALIWDIHNMPRAVEDPILAYSAKGEVSGRVWTK